MPDLHWTIPVARWSCWPDSPSESKSPDIGFIEPIVRRRLSSLSKSALKAAHDCAADVPEVRVVFASRHGELRRSTSVLDDIGNTEPVSPTAFSLSVLNAMSGIFSIARRDNAAATAVSAGPATLGWALLEAYAQHVSAPGSPVLLVYADEPADPRYGAIDDEVTEGALAILLDTSAPARLDCSRHATRSSDTACLRTQSEAVLHCLQSRTSGAWEHSDGVWQWHWREGACQAD